MDVQPQRPRQRVFHDENAAPAVSQSRSLHSRHKSQPVLKAGVAATGLQKLGSRKAFGDLSNVTVNRTYKDDNAITKATVWEKEKVALIEEKPVARVNTIPKLTNDPAPIRPVTSHAVLKSTHTVSTTATSKPTLEIVRPQLVKAVRKSRTTVFQEKPVSQTRDITLQQDLELPRARNVASEDLQKQGPAPLRPAVATHAEAVQPALNILTEPEGVLLDAIVEESTKSPKVYSYAEDLPIVDDPPRSALLPVELEVYESAAEYLPDTTNKEERAMARAVCEIDVHAPLVAESERAPLSAATIPEPEEYWDDYEDDIYPEDGYVTARSFKSLGDNITGNATRTLYPRVDQAVLRELAAAKALVESTRDPDEIEDEMLDTSMVAEYGDEIFAYYRELEHRMAPNPHYMDKQTEIQWSMRAVLMDWIVQVHHRFGLLPETLFLCVNLIDRFLTRKVVSLTKLQLVGATAIFLAAKYEEVDCPSIQEVQFMVDNGYKIEEILKAERFMLSMLEFELGFPGPMSFLRRISKADDYDLETRTLAKYFLEVTIMDERFLPCVSSFVAAGSHCLARLMLRKGNWSPAHVYYSEYTYAQLQPLVRLILECCEDPLTHHAAIYEKYLDKRYKKAASYVQGELQHGFRVPEENVSVQSPVYPTHSYTSDPRYWETPYLA